MIDELIQSLREKSHVKGRSIVLDITADQVLFEADLVKAWVFHRQESPTEEESDQDGRIWKEFNNISERPEDSCWCIGSDPYFFHLARHQGRAIRPDREECLRKVRAFIQQDLFRKHAMDITIIIVGTCGLTCETLLGTTLA